MIRRGSSWQAVGRSSLFSQSPRQLYQAYQAVTWYMQSQQRNTRGLSTQASWHPREIPFDLWSGAVGQHFWIYKWVMRVFVAPSGPVTHCNPHEALSARGFDLVVNRISQQIQQLVPLPGILYKNAGGSRRHLTIQPLFSCPCQDTVKPAVATCIMNAAIQEGRACAQQLTQPSRSTFTLALTTVTPYCHSGAKWFAEFNCHLSYVFILFED